MKQIIRVIVFVGALTLLGRYFVFNSSATFLVSAEQPADSGKMIIPLKGCHIQLIDHVVLATDRIGILSLVVPDEGDRIEKDQKVAGLYDRVALARLAIAEKEATNDIEIRYAKKASEVAHAEYDKAKQTNQQVRGAVPEVEIRRLKLAAERSVLEIEQARHSFSIKQLTQTEAREELKMYSVRAPIDGIVTRVFKSAGEAVRQGDPILEIVNTDRVRIEGYVEIENVWKVKPGLPVSVNLDIPNVELDIEREEFTGKIVFVDAVVEPVTRRTRVWAEVKNRENRLRAGLTAVMTIHLDRNLNPSKSDKVKASR